MADKNQAYREAGVDITKADGLMHWLQQDQTAGKPKGLEVVSGIGGFCALVRPEFRGMKDPVLAVSTDGVGTKVLLGIESGILDGIGQDLVAMCVNDLYTVGARPLMFLDYYATGALDEAQFKIILKGIKNSLASCGAMLLGGETAELPGLYAKGHFDLAGFVVGVVDNAKRINPTHVVKGDKIIGFTSSGFHSNGYSLIRKWLKDKPAPADIVAKLMTPTKIYHEIPQIIDMMPEGSIHALAHITGGGISGNLPRGMSEKVTCVIEKNKIPTPNWMKEFALSHAKSFEDLETTFNWGTGMIAVVSQEAESNLMQVAAKTGLTAHSLGWVESRDSDQKPQVRYQ